MQIQEKIGIFALIIVAIIIIITLSVKIEFKSEFNWIVISISLLSAISIPFLYDHIKQNRKKKSLKKFWKQELRIIKSINPDDPRALETLSQIIFNLEGLEGYVVGAFNEIDHNRYLLSVRMIKDSLDKGISINNIKEEMKKTLEGLTDKN